MKGHKGYHHTHGTHERIEKHMRKHRKDGGKTEGLKGVDDAEKDLKDKPMEYNKGNPEKEAEEMHAKKGGKMEGKKAHHHAGRKHRASGGAAEDHPFTTANKGTGPREGKMMKESEGRDK